MPAERLVGKKSCELIANVSFEEWKYKKSLRAQNLDNCLLAEYIQLLDNL